MIHPRSPLLPTDRPWPRGKEKDVGIRGPLYNRVKAETATASTLTGDQPITETIDQLRILEQFKKVRHTADNLGVIRWEWIPGNDWETEGPPF